MAQSPVSYEVRNLRRETFLIGRQLLLPNGRMRIPASVLDPDTEKQVHVLLKYKHVDVTEHGPEGDADLLERMAKAAAAHNAARAARAAMTAGHSADPRE